MDKLTKRFQQIKELAKEEAKICDEFKGLAFITEELGELAQDLLDGQKEHARLESIDILLSTMAIFFRLGGTDEELDYRLKRNIKKFQRKLKEKK